MMQSPRLEEENIIKHIWNLYRLRKIKKEIIDTTITGNKAIKDRILTDIRNVFRLVKERKAIKDIILSDIKNHFENEEEIYLL